MIEGEGNGRVEVRVASRIYPLTNAMSWVQKHLTIADGSHANKGQYFIRFGTAWFPQEAIVKAGNSEISINGLHSDDCFVQKGMPLGAGGERLIQFELTNAEI